jgi:hypothetical protein
MVNRAVVVTTIFAPTRAVELHAARSDWLTVVVGDRKTPTDWACPGAMFLEYGSAEVAEYALARSLPADHYAQKMLGYLYCIERGARVIADTDDDNLPEPEWSFPPFEGEYAAAPPADFLNVYRLFTAQRIWPRGFPLRRILDSEAVTDDQHLGRGPASVGVWQALADGDPDVDAIYRLTIDQPCEFDDREPVVLPDGTICPYNSQNTATREELFALLYLPAQVTFRFTDILRGLVAQPIMWAAGYRLGFTRATVRQERHEHDYLRDFESEIPCYLEAENVADVVRAAVRPNVSVDENLRAAYGALAVEGVVTDEELGLLDCWLADLATAKAVATGRSDGVEARH